jgi:type I restriction enzyme, S subunit
MDDFFSEIYLPSDWQIKPIAEAYRFTKKPRELKPNPLSVIPFIPMDLVPQGGSLRMGFTERDFGSITSGTYFERGDVLLSKITPSFENGKQGIADSIPSEFGYASTEVIPIQEISGTSDRHYLFYYLLLPAVRHAIASRMEGSTGRQRVPETLIREWKIALPPLREQKIIVAVLKKLQQAIEVETDLIRISRELKSAVMNQLFTKGLRGEPQKETEIGLVPESWEVVPIGDVFSVNQGISLNKNLSTDANGFPFLRTSNVYWGNIHMERVSRVMLPAIDRPSRLLEPGDLLVCEGGEIGRAAIWNGELKQCLFQNHLHRLRPLENNQVSAHFLMYWLEVAFCLRKVYEGVGNKTTIPNLSRSRLEAMPMPLPGHSEQKSITDILSQLQKVTESRQKKLILLDELFNTTLTKLMSAEIRVTNLDLNLATPAPSHSLQGAAA